MKPDAYRDAGVDIDAGDALVDRIKPLARSTARPGLIGGIGGFSGLFALDGRYQDPVLVSGTDGVGTKLLVAQKLGRHETIGIDLVAMCVNDVVVVGAEPLFFLDYFATGKLSVDEAEQVIRGIAEGCRQAGCALLGGETAEMPGMYAPGHYDLAGFAVGAVERSKILDGSKVAVGDLVIALPSTGVHSNGYSLVRKLLVDSGRYDLATDPGGLGETLGDALMRPTRIYVRDALKLIADHGAKALAHITGGGLTGNIPRVLPSGTGCEIRRGSWPEPPIFALLREAGGLSDDEMFRTFNCGVGMVAVVDPGGAQAACEAFGAQVIGRIVAGEGVSFI